MTRLARTHAILIGVTARDPVSFSNVVLGVSSLVCQHQFFVEENPSFMVARLRVSERCLWNSSKD